MMLVKFTNNSEEFESKVEALKDRFSVGAASKVAEKCVNEYSVIDDRLQKSLKENERLRGILSGLEKAARAKRMADEEIRILLSESF